MYISYNTVNVYVQNVLCDLHYQMLYCITTQDKHHSQRCVLRYGVLLSSSLHLFRFFILVFHLKQKHEEGQRLLHYLQQTSTVLETGIICLRNKWKTVDIN